MWESFQEEVTSRLRPKAGGGVCKGWGQRGGSWELRGSVAMVPGDRAATRKAPEPAPLKLGHGQGLGAWKGHRRSRRRMEGRVNSLFPKTFYPQGWLHNVDFLIISSFLHLLAGLLLKDFHF